MIKSYSPINVYERTKLLMNYEHTFWINNNKDHDIKMKNQNQNQKDKIKSTKQIQITPLIVKYPKKEKEYYTLCNQIFSPEDKEQNITNNNGKGINKATFSLSPFRTIQHIPIKQKKTLILDLDETLIHSSFESIKKPDFSILLPYENKSYLVKVYKRPYLDKFIQRISNLYNVYIFTASIEEYCQSVIKELGFNKYIQQCFYRQHCTHLNGIYVKDLTKITSSDLKDIIIVDNNPVSYLFNKNNGLPILSWHDDPNDDELLKIEIILQRLSQVNDVRQIIKQIINNNMIDYEKAKQVLNNLKRKEINSNISRNNQDDNIISSREKDLSKYDYLKRTLNNNVNTKRLIKTRNISPINHFDNDKEIYKSYYKYYKQ